MGKLKVKDGTPVGNANLCNRCSWGQCMTGYRESDRLVVCTNSGPNMIVPFVVLDCSSFSDKHRPDWQQMEKLAIDVNTVRVSSRTAGFSTNIGPHPVCAPDANEEDEAAIRR